MDLMGIWGYEGYVGLRITCRGMRDCGDMRDMRDMRDCGDMRDMRDLRDMRDMRDMRDGPPPRNHPGRAAVFGAAPPNPRRAENGNGKQPATQKKNAYF